MNVNYNMISFIYIRKHEESHGHNKNMDFIEVKNGKNGNKPRFLKKT